MTTEVVGRLRCEVCGKTYPRSQRLNQPAHWEERQRRDTPDPHYQYVPSVYCNGCDGWLVDDAGTRWGVPGADGIPVPEDQFEEVRANREKAFIDAMRERAWAARRELRTLSGEPFPPKLI